FQKSFSRSTEKNCLPSILGYASPGLLTLCLFPQTPELPMTVVAVLAFGDGSATLFGLLYGSARLPWNSSKTWVGTIAFLSASLPLAVLVYSLAATPAVSPRVSLVCGGTAALVAAAVETLPMKGNDNLRVGLAALAGVLLPHALLVGI